MKWWSLIVEFILALILAIYHILERFALIFVPLKWRVKDIKGEIVLITGGGSGIGRLLALKFSRLGAVIVVLDVNEEGNLETVKQIIKEGGMAHAYHCDISKREEVYRVAEQVKSEVGSVYLLFNNAGIVNGKSLMDTPDHQIEKIFDINVMAHFWTVKAFLPAMMSNNHGHVVTIASLAGFVGIHRLVDYCATKFASVGFHEALMAELESKGYDGIKSTVICPFYINTGMFDGVRSRFIPILEVEDAVQQMVNAVLTDETQLVLPKHLWLIVILKTVLPYKVMAVFARFLRTDEFMSVFVGRPEKKA